MKQQTLAMVADQSASFEHYRKPMRRDEFLNVNEFITMHDAREKLRAWQDDYNDCRPHGSLGHLTPSEFATMRSEQPKQAATL